MVKWQGFACAAAAAIGHSGIDATRKYASQTLTSAELVTLVGILDALFLSAIIVGGRLVTDLRFVTWKLLQILVSSSAAKILAGVMYQRALHVAPISTTVPFLAFVPVLLLATSFLLLGEVPSVQGVAGVVVVTAGGYLLALQSSGSNSRGPSRSSSRAGSPRAVSAANSGTHCNEDESLGDKLEALGSTGSTKVEIAAIQGGHVADGEARVPETEADSQARAEPSSPVTPEPVRPRSSILKGNHPVPFSAPPSNRSVARRLTGTNQSGTRGETDITESSNEIDDSNESPDLRAEAAMVLGSDIALDLGFGQDIERAVSEKNVGSRVKTGVKGGQEMEGEEGEEVGGGGRGGGGGGGGGGEGGGMRASEARDETGDSRQRSFTEGSTTSDLAAGGGFGAGKGFYSRASRGRFGTGLGIGLGSVSAQSSPAVSKGRERRGGGEAKAEGEIVSERGEKRSGREGGGETGREREEGEIERAAGGGGGGGGSRVKQQETTSSPPSAAGGGMAWRTRSGRRRGVGWGPWVVLLQQMWISVVGGKEERDGEGGRRVWVKLLITRMNRVRLLLGGMLAPLSKRAGILWQYLHGPVKRLRMVTAWLRAPVRVVVRVVRIPWVVLKGALRWMGAQRRHEGPMLMMGCAVLLSFTNGCDKLGVHHSPSVLVFAGLQRLFMALPPVIYMAATRPSAFPLLVHHLPLLTAISACEITAIVFYLQSLHWLLVSYSVAAKRSNILISMFVGYFLFKENIWKKLPYVLLMIFGMALIIFAA